MNINNVKGETPQWFKNGMEAAMLAPTAMNQQKFVIKLDGNCIQAKVKIRTYKENERWKEKS